MGCELGMFASEDSSWFKEKLGTGSVTQDGEGDKRENRQVGQGGEKRKGMVTLSLHQG